MPEYTYQPLLEITDETTPYEKLEMDGVRVEKHGPREVLVVEPRVLEALSARAFRNLAHLLRPTHLAGLQRILADPEASENDRFVAMDLLRNAIIAAEMEFPGCQDTGTAIVFAKKGEDVYTGTDDVDHLCRGVFKTYTETNLRYSQVAPLTMYEEKNTGTNLPAQVDIMAKPGNTYEFLFVAKGGGSANKTFLYQKTKALLNPKAMERFVREEIVKLGTAACPPYHLAIVIGGTSAEMTAKTVKLASCHYLDHLPTSGNEHGRAFRDHELEREIEGWARDTKIGAQFGGKYFVHDVRVVRMPRHGASCPVAIGVSCSADRNIEAKITPDGVFMEKLETNPARFLPTGKEDADAPAVSIDLNRPMKEICEELSKLDVATRVMLSGPMIVARDTAHAKIKERLDAGEPMPDYLKEMPVYYAGPAKTPAGYASGSFGPTTSQRMDPYVAEFQAAGGSLVMLGKGNRTPAVTDACKEYGGFYLGSIGGPAARLGKECITSVEVKEYEELGMEAIWQIEVVDFPAFIIVDDKGNDFFRQV